MDFSIVLFCLPPEKLPEIHGGIMLMAGMVDKGIMVTEEVYWALVKLKDQGKYRSVDEAIRPLIGLSPARKHPRRKAYEEELHDRGFIQEK